MNIQKFVKYYRKSKKAIKKKNASLYKFIPADVGIGFFTKKDTNNWKPPIIQSKHAIAARTFDKHGRLGWVILLNKKFIENLRRRYFRKMPELEEQVLCHIMVHELIHIASFEKIEKKAYKLFENEKYTDKLTDKIWPLK